MTLTCTKPDDMPELWSCAHVVAGWGARAYTFTNMGVARKSKSKHAAGRKGPVKNKLIRSTGQYKLVGRPKKREVAGADTEASPLHPATRSGVYYHEIWWGLRRIRSHFPNEFPTIGTSVVVCREESEGGGVFSKGTVRRVKPYRSRNAIRVAYDDGGYDIFSFVPSMNYVMTGAILSWAPRSTYFGCETRPCCWRTHAL